MFLEPALKKSTSSATLNPKDYSVCVENALNGAFRSALPLQVGFASTGSGKRLATRAFGLEGSPSGVPESAWQQERSVGRGPL